MQVMRIQTWKLSLTSSLAFLLNRSPSATDQFIRQSLWVPLLTLALLQRQPYVTS